MIECFFIYVAVVNITTFFAFAVDKQKAKRGTTRISEKALITLSFLFGALGGILAMYLFRHKTRKPKFYITLPLFLILQIITFTFLLLH